MIWNKIKISTEQGEIVDGIAPVIISASRATDIPAFFALSFMDDLRKGYNKWVNPFNRKSSYISFANTRLIVFWTKNPAPLLPFLDEISRMGINYYFQFTLNDYENEGFEPDVPALSNRIETFINLSEKLGREKLIWRFDPLVLSAELTIPILLERIYYTGNKLINHTNSLVFSFVDVMNYRKVQNNLVRKSAYYTKENFQNAEFTLTQKHEFAEGLKKISNEWKQKNSKFEISTCAEDINLENFNIKHSKCIDDELIIELFRDDKVLMDFINHSNIKDKGQRKHCRCISSKDIGAYNTCKHLCIYCYALK